MVASEACKHADAAFLALAGRLIAAGLGPPMSACCFTPSLYPHPGACRFLAEKVVHHPTVIAAVAEGRRWRYEGDADVKSKFWGRSIELRPEGGLGGPHTSGC